MNEATRGKKGEKTKEVSLESNGKCSYDKH